MFGLKLNFKKTEYLTTDVNEFGEVVAIHLVRAGDSGMSRGLCYLCYHDRRSAILAVDNFSGSTVRIFQLLRRTLQVQHVECYSHFDDGDATCPSEDRLKQGAVECAPKPVVRRKISMKCRTK
ncbi:unnamed protein product [Heligmosomoides polygyrus]|uniref:RRM domain-containing protein n=1 Tax=Heligmosomoides polygyrus TaxID=6339 RepID=A0A183G9M1_HELPZ|nr:unnamed protein product [Heligmosomoides polygyrus]